MVTREAISRLEKLFIVSMDGIFLKHFVQSHVRRNIIWSGVHHTFPFAWIHMTSFFGGLL